MTGGLIQLVAYGTQDIFLTKDPQITFFKIVYRRHTNFSTEIIPQRFSTTPDFSQKSSSKLPKSGDLMRSVHIVIEMPSIPTFIEDNEESKKLKFAWVKNLGYVLIKSVEIEIGGQLIDKHYGEWMYIWKELTQKPSNGFNKMIGNYEDVNNFTNGKNSFKLYIPLQFWFCKTTGLALPLINLQYNEVKINLELNSAKNCYINAPRNFVYVYSDIVHFEPYEFIYQDINGTKAVGQYIYFDKMTKKLYYNRITKNGFSSITTTISETDKDAIKTEIRKDSNSKYLIIGETSNFETMIKVNSSEYVNRFPTIPNLNIKDCFLLVEYIFLDEEERVKFAKNSHEYLIEQIQFSGSKDLDSTNKRINLGFDNPCKEFVWISQLEYLSSNVITDRYNFSDSYDKTNGNNLILEQTIVLNGQERVTSRSSDYFDKIQQYQNHSNKPSSLINCYSYSLFPELNQPSGTCNMSKIDNISLNLKMSEIITLNNNAKLRVYAKTYNILRVANGLSGLVFTD